LDILLQVLSPLVKLETFPEPIKVKPIKNSKKLSLNQSKPINRTFPEPVKVSFKLSCHRDFCE